MSSGTVESKDDSNEIGTCTDFKPGQKYSTPAPGNGDRCEQMIFFLNKFNESNYF